MYLLRHVRRCPRRRPAGAEGVEEGEGVDEVVEEEGVFSVENAMPSMRKRVYANST